MLVERKLHVYYLNPKQLDRFRDRHSVAGAKLALGSTELEATTFLVTLSELSVLPRLVATSWVNVKAAPVAPFAVISSLMAPPDSVSMLLIASCVRLRTMLAL